MPRSLLRPRTWLAGALFISWGCLGLVAIWVAVWALATAVDRAGLGKAVFDPPGLPVSAAHLRLADMTYEDARGLASCTGTCDGHEAGWKWARVHKIEQASECGGRSQSFIEGCWAYGDEVVRLTGG